MRKDAREAVYRILYAELYNDSNGEDFIKEVYEDLKLTDSDIDFANSLRTVIKEHRSEIDADIDKFAIGYSIERIYSTIKCALIIAFAELKYFDDIPSVVSIDEAVTLVRKYSTKDGINFANGVLASYKKFLENTDENH